MFSKLISSQNESKIIGLLEETFYVYYPNVSFSKKY